MPIYLLNVIKMKRYKNDFDIFELIDPKFLISAVFYFEVNWWLGMMGLGSRIGYIFCQNIYLQNIAKDL